MSHSPSHENWHENWHENSHENDVIHGMDGTSGSLGVGAGQQKTDRYAVGEDCIRKTRGSGGRCRAGE
jgi:hypothetical protein